ncbi:hypothetical protein [Methanoculleus frigidifontis]|uniref:hypothetical protein n=1 Tax=Methanoculleus frigidifontis TaxID=2584085 RepID=UPI00265B5DCD|nr:hypothetical protein [Methanoculleus sp. FWC-SCC1]
MPQEKKRRKTTIATRIFTVNTTHKLKERSEERHFVHSPASGAGRAGSLLPRITTYASQCPPLLPVGRKNKCRALACSGIIY